MDLVKYLNEICALRTSAVVTTSLSTSHMAFSGLRRSVASKMLLDMSIAIPVLRSTLLVLDDVPVAGSEGVEIRLRKVLVGTCFLLFPRDPRTGHVERPSGFGGMADGEWRNEQTMDSLFISIVLVYTGGKVPFFTLCKRW